MNSPLVLIGSKGRPHLPCLKWISDPVVVVEPQDYAAYKEKNPQLDIVVMEQNDKGFAHMMNNLVRVCLERGHRYFVFSDDDVYGMRARNTIEEKFKKVQHEQAREYLNGLVREAEKQGLAQVAVSFAGQSWGAKKAWQYNFGAWGVHVTDARAVKAVGGYDESLLIFNDWEMSARLIQCGYRTARNNLVTFEHKMKSMEGGAAGIYQMPDKVKAAAESLTRKFPGIARVVFDEAHGLWEVRFNWKALSNPRP